MSKSKAAAKRRRAKSVAHVEYELLKHIINNLDVSSVRANLVPPKDAVALKRFKKGGGNIKKLLVNLGTRRKHRLHPNHPDFKKKGD
mgnify:CR=1 FL=1